MLSTDRSLQCGIDRRCLTFELRVIALDALERLIPELCEGRILTGFSDVFADGPGILSKVGGCEPTTG